MKTIEELAKEYAERCKDAFLSKYQNGEFNDLDIKYLQDAFTSGFKASQKWISVEDELPAISKEGFSAIVQTKIDNACEDDVQYQVASLDKTIGWITPIHTFCQDIEWNPTHWRPIESR